MAATSAHSGPGGALRLTSDDNMHVNPMEVELAVHVANNGGAHTGIASDGLRSRHPHARKRGSSTSEGGDAANCKLPDAHTRAMLAAPPEFPAAEVGGYVSEVRFHVLEFLYTAVLELFGMYSFPLVVLREGLVAAGNRSMRPVKRTPRFLFVYFFVNICLNTVALTVLAVATLPAMKGQTPNVTGVELTLALGFHAMRCLVVATKYGIAMPSRIRELRKKSVKHEQLERWLLVPAWAQPTPEFIDRALRETIYRLGFESGSQLVLHCCAAGDTAVADGVCPCDTCGSDTEEGAGCNTGGEGAGGSTGGEHDAQGATPGRMFEVSAYHLLLPIVQREYGRYVPLHLLWTKLVALGMASVPFFLRSHNGQPSFGSSGFETLVIVCTSWVIFVMADANCAFITLAAVDTYRRVRVLRALSRLADGMFRLPGRYKSKFYRWTLLEGDHGKLASAAVGGPAPSEAGDGSAPITCAFVAACTRNTSTWVRCRLVAISLVKHFETRINMLVGYFVALVTALLVVMLLQLRSEGRVAVELAAVVGAATLVVVVPTIPLLGMSAYANTYLMERHRQRVATHRINTFSRLATKDRDYAESVAAVCDAVADTLADDRRMVPARIMFVRVTFGMVATLGSIMLSTLAVAARGAFGIDCGGLC